MTSDCGTDFFFVLNEHFFYVCCPADIKDTSGHITDVLYVKPVQILRKFFDIICIESHLKLDEESFTRLTPRYQRFLFFDQLPVDPVSHICNGPANTCASLASSLNERGEDVLPSSCSTSTWQPS